MVKRNFGNYTLDQLKELNAIIKTNSLENELRKAINKADPAVKNEILGENFSWFHLYEMPFIDHMALCVSLLDWVKEINSASELEDPIHKMFTVIINSKPEQVWTGGFQKLCNKKDLIAIVLSTYRTIKSLKFYQKSLSTLLAEARNGSDDALIQAIRIDRSIVACPTAIHRISMAEMTGDKNFFGRLRSAIKGPLLNKAIALNELRLMMLLLVEMGIDLTPKELEELFVSEFKLYSSTPGAQKNLAKQYFETKKVNHRK